ncbi:lipopolysaccharide heptosyltransferase II [Geobacter sp. SVR]|uniref:lipopolysaccharide heptosyltransferase II n=1 Tax=Geobacter sp. SVR TaxID=2495594 RepID=UPI00143EF6BC|nr:lipopolysaccharide heptosyltransferase II [Geobacter sp. SVR]BCS52422.1 ADP-heptose--LPS heptosyltransferase [Geobacter sp. SVR]GCF87347.1 ADP-heptose--LPS heptosyltransferase [Geobacter sp. SVR]
MSPSSRNPVRRLLVRAVNWIGDAVMTTPAIGLIREHFHDAEITLLANPLVAQLFSPHPGIDRVMTFDRTGAHRGFAGRLRLAAELRRQSFDAAIILPNSFDSALIPWLAGIPVRFGKSSDGRGLLLSKRYSPNERKWTGHEVDYYRELVRHFGITGSVRSPYLMVTPEEQHEANLLLARHGIRPEEPVLGINPGATYGSAKRWYPERFAEVARQLATHWSARVVIFGGPGERDIANDIAARLEGTGLNLAGQTNVRELMALIKRCNFFVTNDSGPMHIAAAFGVPLVAIFGPTDHTGTAPFTDKAVVVRRDVPCAPCKLRECPTDHRCMTAVTAGDVVQAALRLMNEAPGKEMLK